MAVCFAPTLVRLVLTGLVLAGAALRPGRARAQFVLAPGTYQLATGARGTASLQLVLAAGGRPAAVAGVKDGRARTFRSAEVAAFTVGDHRFVRVDGFRLRSGTDADFSDPIFLELLETGPVELFYYHYQVEMGPNFKAHVKLPVLRKAGTAAYFAYSPGRTPGFDPKLAPGTFVAALFPADPVLQRRLALNGIARAQLPDVVRAYNRGVRLQP